MALTQHKGPVVDAAYSLPHGTLLASASVDGGVRLYDADTGEPKAALSAGGPLAGGQAPAALCLAFSPAGDLMATGGR